MIHKKVIYKKVFCTWAVFLLVLAINLGINYRETGNFIILENYSGIPLYEANNPNTKTYNYSSSNYSDFTEPIFEQVYTDSSLSMNEKNIIFSGMAREYMRNHVKPVLKNTLMKFYKMFVAPYGVLFYITITGLFVMILKDRNIIWLGMLVSFLLTAFVTSIGLNIDRYSIVALPFYSLTTGGVTGVILQFACKPMRRRKQNR